VQAVGAFSEKEKRYDLWSKWRNPSVAAGLSLLTVTEAEDGTVVMTGACSQWLINYDYR
jgi:hypothetical protein